MIFRRAFYTIAALIVSAFLPLSVAYAQPFGVGVFGADVPFGDLTSISIDLDSTVNITPTSIGGGQFSGNASQTVTVTSTDVIGYDLYINATTITGLKSDGNTIPASGNGSPAALTVNTWGYNTTGSTSNFKGITTSPVSIDTATGPYKNGRDTTVTYGTLIDGASISGTYTVNVTYTAIGQT